MLSLKNRYKWIRPMAIFMAFAIFLQTMGPLTVYAITSGATQPEVQGFTPANTGEMVDLLSGDFTYNIPLLELPGPNGGYPFNLAYSSGISMDQEASWVGLGWSLNPGVLNRQMRGLPDEFNGDEITNVQDQATNWTVGLSVGAGFEAFGIDLKDVGIGGSFGMSVYMNRFKGIGYNISPSIGFHTGAKNTDKKASVGAGLSLSMDSQEGASISPSISMSRHSEDTNYKLSVGIGYNSKAGLSNANFNLDAESRDVKQESEKGKRWAASGSFGSGISLLSHGYTPMVSRPMRGSNASFTFQPGGGAQGFFAKSSFTGYYNEQHLKDGNEPFTTEAYGYLNLHETSVAESEDQVMDFNRSGDGMVLETSPNLAIPNLTYDIYSAVGQGMSGMYRAYRSDVGMIYDQKIESIYGGGGLDLDIGPPGHFGADLSVNYSRSASGAWENHGITGLGFTDQNEADDLDYEPYFFKAPGEMTIEAEDYYTNESKMNIGGTKPVRFTQVLTGSDDERSTTTLIDGQLIDKMGSFDGSDLGSDIDGDVGDFVNERAAGITGSSRKPRNLVMNPIRNDEVGGNTEILKEFDVEIYSGSETAYGQTYFELPANAPAGYNRESHPDHHFAGFTAFNATGERYVYGLPAYNNKQIENMYSAYGPDNTTCGKITDYDGDAEYHAQGEGLLNKTELPEFAHSHLLTSILGADYVDVDNNGPSDDDFGYWVKFNYLKTSDNYKWRAPYDHDNFIQGKIADPNDDKGSYMYGEKEMYYLASAETKTHIVYFEISQRKDAAGAEGEYATSTGTKEKSYKLDRVKLYSKNDLTTPISTTYFEYTYELCEGVPNHESNITDNFNNDIVIDGYASSATEAGDPRPGDGKLTLRKVWFTYENSGRGKLSPYEFIYDDGDAGTIYDNPDYNTHEQDRWGTYRDIHADDECDMDNPDDYEDVNFDERAKVYTSQFDSDFENGDADKFKDRMDEWASAWHLRKVITPSSGTIEVAYESDDYAYIQNRTAGQMFSIKAMHNVNDPKEIFDDSYDGGITKRRVYFELEEAMPSTFTDATDQRELVEKYIDGMDQIYFKLKLLVKGIEDQAVQDYVSGYAEIDKSAMGLYQSLGGSSDPFDWGYITLKKPKIKGEEVNYHPFALAGWSYLRTNLPIFAGPGGDRGTTPGTRSAEKAAKAKSLFGAFASIGDLFKGYYSKCHDKEFSSRLVSDEYSYIRLTTPDKIKYGGGVRVKKVTLSDGWDAMTGNAEDASTYGQVYEYTTELTDEVGNIVDGDDATAGVQPVMISSGVATYEPMTGGDENPFRRAKIYSAGLYHKSDNNLFFEYPINESYFPGPSVGYSKVTVKSLTRHEQEEGNLDAKVSSTGVTVHEFYTAKDYPVISDETEIFKSTHKLTVPIFIFGNVVEDDLTATQGYSIELNDMHGKPKRVSHYAQDKDGDLEPAPYSYVFYEYFDEYRTVDGHQIRVLDNIFETGSNYKVLTGDAEVINKATGGTAVQMGVDYEFFTDMRYSFDQSIQTGAHINSDILYIPFPLPAFVPIPNVGRTKEELRLSVTNKIIHRAGIMKSVTASDGQSVVTTENVGFDAITGRALLTTVENNYGDDIYSYEMPAHWAYEGMRSGYENIGLEVEGLTGFGSSDQYYLYKYKTGDWSDYMNPGDEFVYTETGGDVFHGIVEAVDVNSANDFDYLICSFPGEDKHEHEHEESSVTLEESSTGDIRIVRSGKRNLIAASAGQVTTLVDPIENRITETCDVDVVKSDIINSETRYYRIKPCMVETFEFLNQMFPISETTSDCSSPHGVPYDLTQAPYDYNDMDLMCLGSAITREFHVHQCPEAYGDVVSRHLHFTTIPGIPQPRIRFYTNNNGQAESVDFYQVKEFSNWSFDPFGPSLVGGLRSYKSVSVDVTYIDNTTVRAYVWGNYDWVELHSTTNEVMEFTDDQYSKNVHKIDNVLQASAVKFSDAWMPDYYADVRTVDETDQNTLTSSMHLGYPYKTGQKGIWRAAESYVYVDDREGYMDNSGDVDLDVHGTFDGMPIFQWDNPYFIECAPKWLKTNTITQYNPYSYETENKDILDIHSSALYGYNGKLTIALGGNAEKNEMGFESFEEYDEGATVNQNNNTTGNLDILTASDFEVDFYAQEYEITSGNGNLAITNVPYSDVALVRNQTVKIMADALPETTKDAESVAGTYTIVTTEKYTDANSDEWVAIDLGLSAPGFRVDNDERCWTGKLYSLWNYETYATATYSNLSITDDEAHTGTKSLKVIGETHAPQADYKLNLKPGETYVYSAWVNSAFGLLPTGWYEGLCDAGDCFSGIATSSDGTTFTYTNANVVGEAIDGWAKVECEFTAPTNGDQVYLHFNLPHGSVSAMYVDDIRIHPKDASIQTYVYDKDDYKLRAVLDDNNYATIYHYDEEGNLYVVKKETDRGIVTVQESRSHAAEQ